MEINFDGQQTIFISQKFGFQFNINDKCKLKNQYLRYYGDNVWEAFIYCNNDGREASIRLSISHNVSEELFRDVYNGFDRIMGGTIRENELDFRIMNKRKDQMFFIHGLPGYQNTWQSILDSIVEI